MGHRTIHKKTSGRPAAPGTPLRREGPEARRPRLEIVLKCGADGSLAAIEKELREKGGEAVELAVIHAGVGEVNKNDILLAATASRLIVGFEVGINPHLEAELRQSGVEVRLYRVIYHLVEDLLALESTLVAAPEPEQVVAQARVVALFKGTRHGIILGCEVESGRLAVGERFRVIGAMGVVYEGRIESLHIEKAEVRSAVPPQRVGLQVRDFQRAAVGDLVESFRPAPPAVRAWRPTPGVFPR